MTVPLPTTATDPYVSLADLVVTETAEGFDRLTLSLETDQIERGRKDLDEPDTYPYTVVVEREGASPAHTTRRFNLAVHMDLEDLRERTPEEELLQSLNFHLNKRGLEARLSTGLQGERRMLALKYTPNAYSITTSETNGSLLLEVPQGEAHHIPQEMYERWRQEAIAWYEEQKKK